MIVSPPNLPPQMSASPTQTSPSPCSLGHVTARRKESARGSDGGSSSNVSAGNLKHLSGINGSLIRSHHTDEAVLTHFHHSLPLTRSPMAEAVEVPNLTPA